MKELLLTRNWLMAGQLTLGTVPVSLLLEKSISCSTL